VIAHNCGNKMAPKRVSKVLPSGYVQTPALYFDSVQLKEITSRDPAILLLYPSTVVQYCMS
jgi:hypothetical protein